MEKGKKFYLWVLGCQMNRADAEKISHLLVSYDCQQTSDVRLADFVIIVACSVRQKAVDRIYGRVRQLNKQRRKKGLKLILTGCVLADDKKKLSKYFDTIISISEINKLPKTLGLVKKQKISRDYLCLSALRDSDFSALVTISNGCNNFCSYCAVPYTRGREKSRDALSIIDECRQLIDGGYKEIILLGQNVNSYRSGDYDFPKLLKEIDDLNGDFWIRFLSSHPKDLSASLIDVMAQGQHITPYLHLALQSGDDEIIKKMNRHYTAKHFLKLIELARKKITNLSVSTDIIVGFPSETKKQFQNTAKVMKLISFDMAYIACYSPRPQTMAQKMKDDVPKIEKKARENKINEILIKGLKKNNSLYLGKVFKVLVDGHKNGFCYGKTDTSKIVCFAGDKDMIGRFVAVKIKRVEPFVLFGEML